MKIQNKSVEVPMNVNLNDKDYYDRLLCKLKELTKGYATAITEASNEKLVRIYEKTLKNYIKLQRQTFEIMFQNGWYIMESAENKKIGEEFKKLNNEFSAICECEE